MSTTATMPDATIPDVQKERGRRFWDSNPCGGDWATYAEFLAYMQRTEPYAYAAVDRYRWTGKQVLDVGCGQGTLLNYLPQRGARVIGVDMSISSIERAAEGAREMGHADRVAFAKTDAEHLPFPDHSFDAVVSFGVLHHSPDTQQGVNEVWRVLKPGGLALVMLYRSGNPKWWATRTARTASQMLDSLSGRSDLIADRLRTRRRSNDVQGTALLELFGVSVLQAFSNREARVMFQRFARVRISNHQPGFRRMADIIPALRPAEPVLGWVDRRVRRTWGFYQVIEAYKGR